MSGPLWLVTAASHRPAVVARIAGVSRQALHRRSGRRPMAAGPGLGRPEDQEIVEIAKANPTDETRMVAALARRALGRPVNRKRCSGSCAPTGRTNRPSPIGHPLSTTGSGGLAEGAVAVGDMDGLVAADALAQAMPALQPAVTQPSQGGVVGPAATALGVVELPGPAGAVEGAERRSLHRAGQLRAVREIRVGSRASRGVPEVDQWAMTSRYSVVKDYDPSSPACLARGDGLWSGRSCTWRCAASSS
jgi:hypothetical protein